MRIGTSRVGMHVFLSDTDYDIYDLHKDKMLATISKLIKNKDTRYPIMVILPNSLNSFQKIISRANKKVKRDEFESVFSIKSGYSLIYIFRCGDKLYGMVPINNLEERKYESNEFDALSMCLGIRIFFYDSGKKSRIVCSFVKQFKSAFLEADTDDSIKLKLALFESESG